MNRSIAFSVIATDAPADIRRYVAPCAFCDTRGDTLRAAFVRSLEGPCLQESVVHLRDFH
jgi:hypothetical protein